MIIVRVPLRVSLFGGGTDLPEYFESHRGSVTGFTINKYIYITIYTYKLKLFEKIILLTMSEIGHKVQVFLNLTRF